MPLNGEAVTFKQLHTSVNMDNDNQGLELANDIQIGFQQLQSGIVFMPSPMKAYPPPVLVKSLHSEILQFAKRTRPSTEIQISVQAAIDCVRMGVKTIWPEADIEVFDKQCFLFVIFKPGESNNERDSSLFIFFKYCLPGVWFHCNRVVSAT